MEGGFKRSRSATQINRYDRIERNRGGAVDLGYIGTSVGDSSGSRGEGGLRFRQRKDLVNTLNPDEGADGKQDKNGKGCTNLEVYLDSLCPDPLVK